MIVSQTGARLSLCVSIPTTKAIALTPVAFRQTFGCTGKFFRRPIDDRGRGDISTFISAHSYDTLESHRCTCLAPCHIWGYYGPAADLKHGDPCSAHVRLFLR